MIPMKCKNRQENIKVLKQIILLHVNLEYLKDSINMGQWASSSKASPKQSYHSDFASKSEFAHRSERKVAKLRSNAEALGTRKGQRRIGHAYGARYKKHMANISPEIAWKRERKLRNRRRIHDSFTY